MGILLDKVAPAAARLENHFGMNEEFVSAASMLISGTAADPSRRVLTFAGVWPGEGTTTVALGVAQALVGSYGRSVAVVELNSRRPTFANRFGLNGAKSLDALLAGDTKPTGIAEVAPGLAVIPAGSRPLAAASGGFQIAFERMMIKLLDSYNFVVFDAPPLMECSDATALGPAASSMVLVVASGRTTSKDIAQVKERLAQTDVRLYGVVLNKRKPLVPRWLRRIAGR